MIKEYDSPGCCAGPTWCIGTDDLILWCHIPSLDEAPPPLYKNSAILYVVYSPPIYDITPINSTIYPLPPRSMFVGCHV